MKTNTEINKYDKPSDHMANLPDSNDVSADDITRLQQTNKMYSDYMAGFDKKMDSCNNQIKQQLIVQKQLDEIIMSDFKTKHDIEMFIEQQQKKISKFDTAVEQLVVLSRENKRKYDKLNAINEEISNDHSLRKKLETIDAVCRTYQYALDIISGDDY
jgi:hypothetical protein